MSQITTGALTFEKVGSSELIISSGLDAMRTITNAAALHDHADQIRLALAQLAIFGTPRTVEFVLGYRYFSAPFVPYLFSITAAEGSQRKLDVGARGYIRVADHHPGALSSGWVAPSVLESLADFFDE